MQKKVVKGSYAAFSFNASRVPSLLKKNALSLTYRVSQQVLIWYKAMLQKKLDVIRAKTHLTTPYLKKEIVARFARIDHSKLVGTPCMF